MSVSLIESSILDSMTEPNWKWVEEYSYLEDGLTGFVAVTDRYARKSMEGLHLYCDTLPEEFISDWQDAFNEGYILDGLTEDEWNDVNDPDYGKDPVYCGPYWVTQTPFGLLPR